MMTCDYKDLTCVRCGGTIPKGDSYSGSFVRPRHTHDCQQEKARATARRQPVLDSYEQECEDEGVKMGYTSY
jgi:hypothetical protein